VGVQLAVLDVDTPADRRQCRHSVAFVDLEPSLGVEIEQPGHGVQQRRPPWRVPGGQHDPVGVELEGLVLLAVTAAKPDPPARRHGRFDRDARKQGGAHLRPTDRPFVENVVYLCDVYSCHWAPTAASLVRWSRPWK
jgi:hypothetical protein